MLTGFHGLHVFVGTLMLLFITLRLQRGHFTPERHFGFEGAAWYWHFVDVVWLGLYVVVLLDLRWAPGPPGSPADGEPGRLNPAQLIRDPDEDEQGHRQPHPPGQGPHHAARGRSAGLPVTQHGTTGQGQGGDDGQQGQSKDQFHATRLWAVPRGGHSEMTPGTARVIACVAGLATVLATAALGQWQLRRADEKQQAQTLLQTRQQLPAWQSADWPCDGRSAEALPVQRTAQLTGTWLTERTVWLDNRHAARPDRLRGDHPLAPACAGQRV